ncbi:MAG: hypothetical protein K1000chlam4_00803, partial [Chlamydiae bacterium]|nr:hypothetical protein [Chlamydiota bacterium]
MSSPTNLVVLQGEVGVAQNSQLKAPVPTASLVLTLFHEQKHIAVMAYLDDFTPVQAVFNRIEAVLRTTYQETLTSSKFVGKLMAGSEDPFSQDQRKAILQTLVRLGIKLEQVTLPSPRPQITLDGSNGSLYFSDGTSVNKSLEFLQLREYGKFNDLLDYNYSHLPGDQIPDFEPRTAARPEPHLPAIDKLTGNRSAWIAKAQNLENAGKVDLSTMNFFRFEIKSASLAKEKLAKIPTDIKIKESVANGNFNLALRQAAADKAQIKHFQALLDYA